ncbi:EamA family transporter [Paraneptunicella aestuarii]|uniref:EamA family transporter n=1 Tax=Paraneptunicella aestuarii TaxID=2831148 RepID=UPI001E5702EC|nr:EamA family transporter [Paraneptunicella aestuarii]UAA39915.1 EamA family transporter [Paraneptunicella aestuarii]
MTNRSLFDYLLAALAPAIWGSTYLVTTELLPPDSPVLASVVRALPAGIILMLIGQRLPQGAWWWKAFVLGVLNIGAFFYFVFLAAYHLPGGVAALIMSSQPLIVMLLGSFLLKEKVTQYQVIACFVGAIGVALLVLKPSAQLDAIGVFAGLAGASCMASGIVMTKRWGRPQGVNLLTFTGWQLTVGGAVLLPIALMTEGLPETITSNNIIGFTFLCLVGSLFAYVIWFRGVERIPAVSVSLISFSSPLSATILGYLILNQSLTGMQLVGAVAILAAIFLAQPRAAKATPQSPQLTPLKGNTR